MRAARTLVTLTLFFIASTASAGTHVAAVLPPTGVNIGESTLLAAQDILRRDLDDTHVWQEVIAVPGAPSGIEPDAATAVNLAGSADVAVVLHLVRLGTSIHVRLCVYATANSLVLFSDHMPADGVDDLDRVLARLTKAVVLGRPASETAELHTVTAAEAAPPLKRGSTHSFGISIDDIAPDDGPAISGFSLYWLYDAQSFLADVTLGLHEKGDNGDARIGLGVYLPLGSGDFTPYLGGGARWAATDYGNGHGSGIQLYGAVGTIAFRFGSVQLRSQLEYFVNTYQTSPDQVIDYVDGEGGPQPPSHHYDRGVAVSVGLGF